jgi:uncharacterized membrane protein
MAEVAADPEQRKLVFRVSSSLKKAGSDTARLALWALLILIGWLVFYLARIAPNDLGAVALIFAIITEYLRRQP